MTNDEVEGSGGAQNRGEIPISPRKDSEPEDGARKDSRTRMPLSAFRNSSFAAKGGTLRRFVPLALTAAGRLGICRRHDAFGEHHAMQRGNRLGRRLEVADSVA